MEACHLLVLGRRRRETSGPCAGPGQPRDGGAGSPRSHRHAFSVQRTPRVLRNTDPLLGPVLSAPRNHFKTQTSLLQKPQQGVLDCLVPTFTPPNGTTVKRYTFPPFREKIDPLQRYYSKEVHFSPFSGHIRPPLTVHFSTFSMENRPPSTVPQ